MLGGDGDDRLELIGEARTRWQAKFFGQGGNDLLVGGERPDQLIGGPGHDQIHGRGDSDIIRGDEGNDLLWGDRGDDRILGGIGNDQLFGGLGVDSLFGEDGNDYLFGEAGNDLLHGGSGNDELYSGAGENVLIGGTGRDKLYGGIGSDLLLGGTTEFDSRYYRLSLVASIWSSGINFRDRVNATRLALPVSRIVDDRQVDLLFGDTGRDWYVNLSNSDVLRGVDRDPINGDVVN